MSFPKHEFQGVNEGYVLELYDRWRQDPGSVDQSTRDFFATWTPFDSPAARSDSTSLTEPRAKSRGSGQAPRPIDEAPAAKTAGTANAGPWTLDPGLVVGAI